MEFEVLESGKILMPYFQLKNEEGVNVFSTIDQDVQWHTRERLPGRYTSTAWVPGNLLSEGTLYVLAAMRTEHRRYRPFLEADVVAFNVIDTMEGGTVRGNWAGRLIGAVRPMLDWTTEYLSKDSKSKG
jgi:homopolymeric O-antigen transport system ATP-binding protein